MALPAQGYVTLEEFLLAEAADSSGVRREWVDGQVFAFVLVSQTVHRIEVLRRATGWQPEVVETGTFTVHGAELSVSAIYAE